MADQHSEIVQLRTRTRGRRLREADPFDARAMLYRAATKIAALADPDADRVAAALLAVVDTEEPPALEALLGIPERWAGADIERRNEYLRRVARELDIEPGRSLRDAVHAEWERFAIRLWPQWRDDEEPPPDCSHLHRLLFWATKCSRGKVLQPRQIGSIVGSAIETA